MPWKFNHAGEQTVLLPFDFSTAATEAIATARDMVARPELLYVVHVIAPLDSNSPAYLAGALDLDKLRARADAALEKALREAGVEQAQRRISTGDPASEILDVAREIGADLIVIPSHGKTGLLRWMLGSVAERVVRRATCPVLVLPVAAADEEG
jgi:nucleotide-binding universal stress UspA family protein